jgi:hypothetical protein
MFNDVADPPFVFDGRNYIHREVRYSPEFLRQKRSKVYILTNIPNSVNKDFLTLCDGLVENLDAFTDEQINSAAFYVYFSRAELVLPHLRRIVSAGGLFAPPSVFSKVPFSSVSALALDSYNEAGRKLNNDPMMGLEVHTQLCQAVELTKNLPGDFVEIGVFTGSSALTSLTHMRNLGTHRRCWLLDTYEGFNYKTALESSDVIWAHTHLANKEHSINRITNLMSDTKQDVRVVSCEIVADPLPKEIQSIALANVDVDLYEAVLASLNKLAPLMVKRGIMVVEDPTSLPGLYGAYLAMNEFLDSDLGKAFIGVRATTQYFLIRVD